METEEKELLRDPFLNLDRLLDIIGNPTRRVILSKLAKVPLGASELKASFGTDISRQAIHSQLKILEENGFIESDENKKYRIKSSLSVRIDITPDYYKVHYVMSQIDDNNELIALKDIGYKKDYDILKTPNEKLRFIGESIKGIEHDIKGLEIKRRKLLQNKECLIIELKNIMAEQYEKKLMREQPNLEKEIFFTLFYNPIKYVKRINIDSLLDDMFFSKMGIIRRDQTRVEVRHLLRDLSKFMDVFREDEDDWFFDL